MKIRYALASLVLLITSQASAERSIERSTDQSTVRSTDQYAIHLDTSKSSNISDYKALRFYGDLYTVEATQGYITTLLGPYSGKQLVGEILNRVRVAGYYGALITKYKNTHSPVSVISKHQYSAGFSNTDLTHTDRALEVITD